MTSIDATESDRTESRPPEAKCELSRQSLQLLESLELNNFENALNCMEEFLYGFELCDHTLHFDTIANILLSVIAAFAQVDKSGDGVISYKELLGFAQQNAHQQEFDWLLCHYEALVKASLLPKQTMLSRDALVSAEHVFRGLDYVQKHVKSPKIQLAQLRAVEADPNLNVSQKLGLEELTRYLEKHMKRGEDVTISASELAEISPEAIWLSSD